MYYEIHKIGRIDEVTNLISAPVDVLDACAVPLVVFRELGRANIALSRRIGSSEWWTAAQLRVQRLTNAAKRRLDIQELHEESQTGRAHTAHVALLVLRLELKEDVKAIVDSQPKELCHKILKLKRVGFDKK